MRALAIHSPADVATLNSVGGYVTYIHIGPAVRNGGGRALPGRPEKSCGGRAPAAVADAARPAAAQAHSARSAVCRYRGPPTNRLDADALPPLYRDLGVDRLRPDARLHCIRAIRSVPLRTRDDLLTAPVPALCARLAEMEKGRQADAARWGVNCLLRLVGRPDAVTARMVENQRRHGVPDLTRHEALHATGHPAYLALPRGGCVTQPLFARRDLMRFIDERRTGAGTATRRDLVARALRIFRELPRHGNALGPTVTALVAKVWRDHPCSLLRQNRQSRQTSAAADAVRELAARYGAAARELAAFLQWPAPALHPTAIASEARRSSAASDPLPAVHDVVSLSELARIEAAAAAGDDVRDGLLVLLLGRLGMRIGAAVQLRLAGIVADDELRPGAAHWPVRRVILGRDKNGQINQWDTMFVPAVHDALEAYVNGEWRRRHERWLSNGRLMNGYLFPGRRAQTPWSRRYASGRVTAVMLAAGIDRRRAHCHALRKGFVTALLNAGNPITSVARMVHHRCSAVTERSYDKRTYDEVVQRMVLPIEWAPPPAGADATAGGDAERAAVALLEEMDRSERLERQLAAALLRLEPAERAAWADDQAA